MRIGPFDFSPALWPSLAMLVVFPALVWLGFWQLERADWKQDLVNTHAERIQQPAQSLGQLPGPGDEVQYRNTRVRGNYDLGRQLLLDNRTYNGKAGYHVLTPLQLSGRDTVVLVNRGWVPMGYNRSILPDLPGPDDEVSLEAVIKLPPEKLFRLDEIEEANTGWPKVVQQLEIKQLEKRLGVALLPVVLLLDKQDEHGFVRDWKPVYGIPADKHRAYALQWFTLAAVLMMIYIGVNTKRRSKE
jgi:surfeit locus 1 family protein